MRCHVHHTDTNAPNIYLCVQNGCLSQGSFCPTNCNGIFEADGMQHEDAYDKAIELIMQDPYHNICEITYTGNKLQWPTREEDRER